LRNFLHFDQKTIIKGIFYRLSNHFQRLKLAKWYEKELKIDLKPLTNMIYISYQGAIQLNTLGKVNKRKNKNQLTKY
jgi:hypothetical protein